MKNIKSCAFRAIWWGMLCAVCMLHTSCSTPQRKLSLPSDDDGTASWNVNDYVHEYKNAPEMLPRERVLLERELELRINYAINKAMLEGKVKVRAIAPLLQLSGDDSLDRSSRYTITLVADDLIGTNTFLNEYAVIVGPDPALAVVAPAVSAPNLPTADYILAQDKLNQLQMDSALLRADQAFQSLYLTNFQDQITNMLNTSVSNAVQQQTILDTITTNLTDLDGKLSNSLTNKEEFITLINKKNDLESQRRTVTGLAHQAQIEAERLKALQRQSGTALSAVAWNKEQTTFWAQETNRLGELSRLSISHYENATNTAVTITLRPSALKHVNQLTIEVLRKKRVSSLSGSSAISTGPEDSNMIKAKIQIDKQCDVLITCLTKFDESLRNIRKVLNITDKKVDKWSELTLLRHYSASFAPTLGALKGLQKHLKPESDVYCYINRILTSDFFTTNSPDRTNALNDILVRNATLSALESIRQDTHYVITRLKDDDYKTSVVKQTAHDYSLMEITNKVSDAQVGIQNTNGIVNSLEINPIPSSGSSNASSSEVIVRLDNHPVLQTSIEALAKSTNGSITIFTNLAKLSALFINKTNKIEIRLNPGNSLTNILNTSGTNILEVYVNDKFTLRTITTNLNSQLRFGAAGGQPVDSPAASDSNVHITPPDSDTSLALIQSGDKYVFRFNVLRGIVSTTAFLVPDDGVCQLFGPNFAAEFHVAQVTLSNPNQQPILIYGNTLRLIVRMTASDTRSPVGEDGYQPRVNWWATYQPMDYQAVLAMLQRSNNRDWRAVLAKYMDFATKVAGFATLYTRSLDLAKGIAFFSGTVEPATRDLLLVDLKKNEENFQKVGLNSFEEIQSGQSITRYLFLPKGPIFGDFSYNTATASELPSSAEEIEKKGPGFALKGLQPTYIYNIRREEAYVEGKRILASDPLSSVGTK